MPVHKSKAITYITPADRKEAVRQQTLLIQGKGPLANRKSLEGPIFQLGSPPAGSFDKVQSEKNKILGYW